MPEIVRLFFVGFFYAFNPCALFVQPLPKAVPGTAFKAITPNTIPAELFKNYVAKGSQFVLPPLDSLTLAAILGWYLYNWLKK